MLPLRKTKGKCDKHREQRVEVICTPIVSQDAMDGEEGENRELLKAEMGLRGLVNGSACRNCASHWPAPWKLRKIWRKP